MSAGGELVNRILHPIVFGEPIPARVAKPRDVSYYCGRCRHPVPIDYAVHDLGCPRCGEGATEADLRERLLVALDLAEEYDVMAARERARADIYRGVLAKLQGGMVMS
jgi:ribosomal protein S27AE